MPSPCSLKEMSRQSLALGCSYLAGIAAFLGCQRGAGGGRLCLVKDAELKPMPGAKGGRTGAAALP